MSTKTMTLREHARALAASFGLSAEETGDFLSEADTLSKLPVAERKERQAGLIRGAHAPGALRGPSWAARNALHTVMVAQGQAEALPEGSPERQQVLAGAGLAPPVESGPSRYQVEVSNWHDAVSQFNDRKARLRKVADNPIGKPEEREAARSELAQMRQPPPPKPPIPGTAD